MASPDSQKIRRTGDLILVPEDSYNDLCDAGDAFLGMTVTPTGAGKLTVAGKKAILDLPGLANQLPGFMIVRIDPDTLTARLYEDCSLSVTLGTEVV